MIFGVVSVTVSPHACQMIPGWIPDLGSDNPKISQSMLWTNSCLGMMVWKCGQKIMQDASDGGPPNAIQHLGTQKRSVLHAAMGLAPSHSGLLSTGDTGSLYNGHSNHARSHGIHQESLDGKKGDFLYTGNLGDSSSKGAVTGHEMEPTSGDLSVFSC